MEDSASCASAEQSKEPCFPAGVALEGPRYSVAESLNAIDPRGPPDTTAPSLDGGKSNRGGMSFDPVCTAKQVLGLVKGRSYSVYRVSDGTGAHAAIFETTARLPANGAYELFGTYTDPCEAVAAFRRIERKDLKDLAKAPPAPRGPVP